MYIWFIKPDKFQQKSLHKKRTLHFNVQGGLYTQTVKIHT